MTAVGATYRRRVPRLLIAFAAIVPLGIPVVGYGVNAVASGGSRRAKPSPPGP